MKMHLTTGANWLKLGGRDGGIRRDRGCAEDEFLRWRRVTCRPRRSALRRSPIHCGTRRRRRSGSEPLENIMAMEQEILSRTSLHETVLKLDLYERERQRMPLKDVIEEMRRNIRFAEVSLVKTYRREHLFWSIRIKVKAQAAVRELATKFTRANATVNHYREMAYRSFWQDEAKEAASRHVDLVTPPPPTGEIVAVLDPASLPKKPAGPNRIAISGMGPRGGAAAGHAGGSRDAMAARGKLQLGGFASRPCVPLAPHVVPDSQPVHIHRRI